MENPARALGDLVEDGELGSDSIGQAFIDAIGDQIIVMDPEHRIIGANRSLLGASGRSRSEVVGRTCHDILHGTAAPCPDLDSGCPLDAALAAGKPVRATHVHGSPDGDRYVDLVVSPVVGRNGNAVAGLVAIRDITHQVWLERDLMRRNKELALRTAIVQAGMKPLPMDQVTAECLGTVLDGLGSPAGWLLMLQGDAGGFEIGAVYGLAPELAQSIARDRKGGCAWRKAVSRQEVTSGALPVGLVAAIAGVEPSPGAVYVPIKGRDGVIGCLCLIDVSGSIAADLDLVSSVSEPLGAVVENARLHATMNLHARALEDAHRRREEFAASVAHELKGVAGIMSGYAQLLTQSRSANLSESKREGILRSIVSHSVRLGRLVEDLRDAGSIETQRFSINAEAADLVPILEQAIDGQQHLTDKHVIVLETDEPAYEVSMDRDRVRQVLDNLLGNAVKYSPAGGAIKVAARRGDGEVQVSVSDQGMGIPASEFPNIFLPYARAHQEIKGLGLGLYISKAIIEAHGGRVWAGSLEGEGSTFTFTLPA